MKRCVSITGYLLALMALFVFFSPAEASKRIYVGNLPFGFDEEGVMELFEAFGEVNSVALPTDRLTVGKPSGYGFVEMEFDEEADEAIDALDGTTQPGSKSPLEVREARPGEGEE